MQFHTIEPASAYTTTIHDESSNPTATPWAMPESAIGFRTDRYGPATTRRFGIAEGSGVPFPCVAMAAADAIPRALAATSATAPATTEAVTSTSGSGGWSRQRCSANAT